MSGKNIQQLEELFEAKPDHTAYASKSSSLFSFFIASIVGGLLIVGLVAPVMIPIMAAPVAAHEYWESLPGELPDPALPQRSVMLDTNGNSLGEFYSENRVLVSLDQVSPYAIDALIATEDARFYTHNGVDWRGVGRAFVNNAKGMTSEEESASLQGASTLTQQLVKNTLIIAARTEDETREASEITFDRKMAEIKYAVNLEENFTKDEILEKYLNVVLYSNGVYGIGTAAKYYFNVDAANLTLSQSATLIGLLKNPTGYDPIDHPDAALGRRNVVIERMVTTEKITREEADAAIAEPLNTNINRPPNGCASSPYPFYCQWVMDSILEDDRFGSTREEREATVYLGGLTITTSLDPAIQDAAQADVDSALGRDNRVAGGIAIVQPGTGQVLALAQNRGWGTGVAEDGSQLTQIVYPVTKSFQSGSTFKVFTLAAALEAGYPADSILNAPDVFNPGDMNVPDGGIKNDGPGESGPLDINTATALSSNTYYATLQREAGVLVVADMARNLGVTVPDTVTAQDGSFTLGVIDTSPLEMSAAYAAFAADGLYCAPTGIKTVMGQTGELTPRSERCYQAVSKKTANVINQALVGVIDGPLPNRTGKDASIGRPAAGKTGTTSSHAAAWFVGYTPQYSTAVWIGDPRGGFKYPLSQGVRFNGRMTFGVYGSDIAAPIWQNVMAAISAPQPVANFSGDQSGGLVGTSIVPDVRGMGISEAVTALKAQGFKVNISETNAEPIDGVQPNLVVAQTPEGSTKIFNVNNTSITLTLSSGSESYISADM
jgi:membrane peptidoglycan carboxypeptidase